MSITKTIIAVAAAVAVTVVQAGDSAPFLLDTAEGTRIAQEVETIAYSTAWNNGDTVLVTADGVTLKEAVAPASGDVAWSAANAGVGGHALTHTSGGETLTARFAVLGDDVVVHAGPILSSEVWDTNKVHLVTAPVIVGDDYDFSYFCELEIQAGAIVKFMPGSGISIKSNAYCRASGAIFTHVNDDTIGGDTLMDGDETVPVMNEYDVPNMLVWDDEIEFRYFSDPKVTLSGTISADEIWRGHNIYCVTGNLTVASGKTLTIMPGTIVKFAAGLSLTVNGTLDAQGTRAAPIIFTSLKDDEHGGDTNGDGEKTYAQAGDWYQISVPGTANFNYCHVLYNSSTENTGAIDARGGTVNFDNSEIAHTKYECVNAHNSGYFTARNSIFRDSSLGFGYYGSGRVKAYNCVFVDLTTSIRQSGKTLTNCIFYRCLSFTDQSGDGSTFKNCVFYNPVGYGAQSYSKCGSNGNIWGDPMFVDPENGDFRIAANSPCVDAGDGTVAPETDYWGQPRMDVKRVKDTGTPNGDGVCPDIGIYEVPGAAKVPLPDLAVVSISRTGSLPVQGGNALAARCTTGDAISFTYVVTNRGAAEASGLVRDLFRFKGADAATAGLTIDAAEIEKAYNVAAGGSAEFTATLTVPTLKAGMWKVEVGVNVGNYPYEQNLSNNRATSEDVISVELEAMGMGAQSVTVGKGESAGFVLSGLPTAGGVVRVTGAGAAQIAAYGGNGVVPTSRTGCQPVQSGNGQAARCTTGDPAVLPLADGSLLVFFPARAEGENAYLVLENGGNAAATVSVEVKETELKIYCVEPGRVANVGEATVTITGSGLVRGSGTLAASGDNGGRGATALPVVTLGGREAKSVEVLNAAQIAATFDVDGMAAGTYDVAASIPGAAWQAALQNAVEVYAAKTGPKLRAWLEMPSSVRDGRVFTGYVCYANEGDSPMTMPVFKIAREDSQTKMGLVASESMTETKLYVGGISPTHPAGVLKAGDAARIPFYFQPFGTYRIKLSHVKDAEDLEAYPTFGGTKAYLAAMSAAATRLNLRGRTAYNVHDFVDQALWEKNGVAHAAVSGYLVDAKTGEPLANTDISLVAADSEAQLPPVTGTTDESGYFQLTNLADGEYRWLLDDGNTLADASTNTVTIAGQVDLNGASVSATPGGRIAGYVLTTTGEPVAYGTVARLNEDGSLVDAVEADGFGAFVFTGLSDGVYAVQAMPKDGYASGTITNIVIDAVTRTAEIGFALEKGAQLGGVVAFNGVAVTNGTVQAITTDGTSYEVLCATNGTYRFDGLSAGSYAVRYYTKAVLSDDVDVTLSIGDDMAVDLVAKERPLFISTRSVGFGSCEAKFIFTDPTRAENVSAWAWDFDSDGVVDSAEPSPTWNYTQLGTNTVTLVITENGRQTTSVYRNCVRVEQPLETILADNAILFGTNSGTLQAVSIGEGTLVLSGNPASGTLAPGMVLMGQCGEDWFCRRIVSANQSGGQWMLTTEGADWDDIYEQVAEAVGVEGYYSSEAPLLQSASRPRLMASPSNDGVKMYVEGGFTASVGVDPDFRFEWIRQKRNGRSYQKWAILGSLKVSGSVGFEGTVGVKYHKTLPSIIGMSIPTGIPGVTVRSTGKVFFEADAHATGSYKASGEVTGSIQLGRERYDREDWKWLPPFDIGGTGTLQGDLEGSVSARVGFVPSFAVKLLETASVKVESEAYAKFEVKASAKAPAEATLFNGVDISFSANAVDWDFGWLDVQVGAKGTLEGPRHEVAKWIAPDPDFDYTPSSGLEAPVTVNFINQSKGTTIRILRTEWVAEPKEFEWDFGNGTCSIYQTAVNPTATYSSKGKYDVYLRAKGLITGPYRKKKTIKVGEKDDDDGDEETDDTEEDRGKQSCDPNAVEGDEGVGEARYVKPGQELTYTIYFENKAGFDIADAQEVKVTNPLSEWLDWSTFEMREVAFNNQNDVALDGLSSGTRDIKMNGTNKYVRVALGGGSDGEGSIATTGVAHWYLRVFDPNGQFGWPNDLSGFLPSNDSTHRGEGHLTYRIKVREDAPANVVITNSASIVFDKNDPIETDPAWWNTVSPVDEFLQTGEYFKMTLAELGYDVPTDGKTPYTVKALGLPAGLKLVGNKAVKDKKGKVTKKANVEWWIEGVPTAPLDFYTNPPYLVITANGATRTETLPLEVNAQEVTDLGELALGETVNTNGWLAGVEKGWTVSGLPTGLKFATKKVTKKSGKKTVTVAEAYAVYGKTTKAGLFTITAKKKTGAYYETLKFRVLVRPAPVDRAIFGEELTNIMTMAYVPFEWYLTNDVSAVGGKVAKVAGLPTGLTFAAANTYSDKKNTKLKQSAQTIVGKPTKPGTYVVTFTKNVKSGKKTVAKTAQILWVVEPNDVEPELDFNTEGGEIVSGSVGLKYGDLLAFSATSNATVTASGVPSGIKLVKLDGSAGGLALPGQAAWGFQGFTTKAGTYLVTVKATLNGKTVTQRLALKVEGLPAWAKGTYNGYVRGSGTPAASGEEESGESAASPRGLATVTVSTVGKISGKFYEGGTNWTLTAASYTGYDPDASNCTAVVTAKYSWNTKKSGKGSVSRTFALSVAARSGSAPYPGGVATLTETGESQSSVTEITAWQNLWGSTYKAVGKALFSTKSGKKTLAYKTFTIKGGTDLGTEIGLRESDSLTLKITTAGAVTATLTYDTGKTKKDKNTKKTVKVIYKPTCTTVVIPTSGADAETFTGRVPLFLPSSAANNFPGLCVEVAYPFVAHGVPGPDGGSSWFTGEFNGYGDAQFPAGGDTEFLNGLFKINVAANLAFTGTFTGTDGSTASFSGTFAKDGSSYVATGVSITVKGKTMSMGLMCDPGPYAGSDEGFGEIGGGSEDVQDEPCIALNCAWQNIWKRTDLAAEWKPAFAAGTEKTINLADGFLENLSDGDSLTYT